MSTTNPIRHSFGSPAGTTERGIEMFARHVESPSGTVVMVHGTLDRGGSFSRMARRLEGLDAIAFDRRGYQSSRSLGGAAHLSDHLDDLREILTTAAARGPVTLVGHSFGGVIAIAAAAAMPEAMGALVVYEPPMPWLWEEPPHHAMVVGGDPAVEVEQFFRRMVSNEAWEHLSEAERQSRIADGAGLMSDLRIIRGEVPFTLDDIATLEIPITIGIGASISGHRRAAERVVATAPHGVLVHIEGAPHGAHLSHPDSLAELVMTSIAVPKE